MSNKNNIEWTGITAQKPEVGYIKLKNGKNQIRLASKPALIDFHWVKTKEKNTKIMCTDKDCPCCAMGNPPKSRYTAYAFDHDGEQGDGIKLFEYGITIARQIKALYLDEDFGDPLKYDLKINKTGQGLDTRYLANGSPRKMDYNDAEKREIESAQPLSRMFVPKTPEEIEAMGIMANE